jgi:nucleoside-diphosphate-sugar epimerase
VVGGIGANRDQPCDPGHDLEVHIGGGDGRDVREVWGDGTPTREFLDGDDAVERIVRATELCDGGTVSTSGEWQPSIAVNAVLALMSGVRSLLLV